MRTGSDKPRSTELALGTHIESPETVTSLGSTELALGTHTESSDTQRA